nr:unnamed protein product [Spirometra erinaceieuropaei]
MQLRSHQKKQLNQRGLMTEKKETELGRLRSTRRKELPGVEKQSSSEQSTETSSASVDTDAANANILCIDIKDMSSNAPNTKPLAAEKIPEVDGNQNFIMNGSPGTPKSPTSRNQDRPLREQCLVIQGLQEPQADTPKERVLADLGLFQGLLNTLLQPDEEISVLKAFRLGKRSTEPAIPPHPRPLKIVLSCKEHVDLILSRRFRLKYSHQGVFFQPDYTPPERIKRRQLVQELRLRQTNGEQGLVIYNNCIIERPSRFVWTRPVRMSPQPRQLAKAAS